MSMFSLCEFMKEAGITTTFIFCNCNKWTFCCITIMRRRISSIENWVYMYKYRSRTNTNNMDYSEIMIYVNIIMGILLQYCCACKCALFNRTTLWANCGKVSVIYYPLLATHETSVCIFMSFLVSQRSFVIYRTLFTKPSSLRFQQGTLRFGWSAAYGGAPPHSHPSAPLLTPKPVKWNKASPWQKQRASTSSLTSKSLLPD